MNEHLMETEIWLRTDTITVGRLIQILEKYDQDMPVITTWQGTIHSVEEKWIYKSCTGALYIDADEGFYKEDYKE